MNVLFPGTEKIQKVHAHVFAGLADAQKNQIALKSVLNRRAGHDITKRGKRFDIQFRHTDSEQSAALKAVSREDTRSASDAVLSALKAHLGAKLGMITGALTFWDVAGRLHSKGVSAETIKTLQNVFRRCAASRYGGMSRAGNPGDLIGQCQEVVGEIEQVLK